MTKSTLSSIYTDSFRSNWNNLAFSDYEGKDFLYSDIARIIKSLHLYYQIMGIRKGDKIAVLGRNSAHWGAIFLSAISYGALIVPILPDFNNENTNHIINHSESKILFCSKSLVDKVKAKDAPLLEGLVILEDFSMNWAKDPNNIYKLDDAHKYYRENAPVKDDFSFTEWDREDPVIISYTSGSTGSTKGVLIPERSLVSNIIFAQDNMPLKPGDKIVSFLPMAHVYGLLFEFLFPVTLGCHITFLNKMPAPQVLTKAFQSIRPHLILSVPLVIEKIYKKRILPAIEKPAMKILLNVPGINSVILKKIRAKLTDTFGGRFFEIVIGGAPLSADIEKFFKRIHFPFTIGYGMTECGPLISYAAWNKTRTGSAGKVVDRMVARIDSEDPFNSVGEIQVKGDNVMLGYYKNEKATADSFTDDGWLKTGDLGVMDADNFIYIRGRSKNMILGPSGQNIYPEEIEAKLSNLPYVAECVVIERNNKLIGLVYPDLEAMKADGIQTSELDGIMTENVKKLNHQLHRYEQVNSIQLMDEEFEKTPKKNIKRFIYT